MIKGRQGEFGPRILIVAASGLPGGAESLLAGAAARELAIAGADVTRISAHDHPLPLMTVEALAGPFPDTASRIARLISTHDRLLMISGERNASMPAEVKNLIDWVSARPVGKNDSHSAFAAPRIVLATITAAVSAQSAIGDHLRTVLHAAGARDLAATIIFRAAEMEVDAEGRLADRTLSMRIRNLADALLRDQQAALPG